MLPQIGNYQTIAPDKYPKNRCEWTLDNNKSAILVHDMQNYFVNAFTPDSQPIQQAITNISQILTLGRTNNIPIFFTAQPPRQNPDDRGLLTDFWGPGIQTDSDAEIITTLNPHDTDNLITKWRYDAFVRTNLLSQLHNLGRNQLLITGIYAHIGCLMTACSAFMLDIKPFLIADAVADFSAADHTQALQYIATRCGTVLDTNTALSQLKA